MLKERAAIVTGSTSGIGFGIARALAIDGCRVMLNGFGDPGAIEEQRRILESESGSTVLYDGADLCKPGEAAALVDRTISRFGRLDVLVNNAGRQFTSPVEAFPVKEWDSLIALNLSAPFLTIQRALPKMREQGWGRIINIASVHGLVASVNKAAYVASKHALVGLTKVAALETAGSGITVNAICPGWTRTELIEPQIAARAKTLGLPQEGAARNLLAEKQPSQQFVTVDQIGQLAVFLCSAAASQITGIALPIDGGWTAQ